MIFVDEAKIFVKSGDGGKGCESFYREKYFRHPRPNGGDGGDGGSIIVAADKKIQTLLDFKFKQHYKAEKGGNGSSKNKKGKTGEDCILKVPIGTIIRDAETGFLIRDLVEDEQSVTIVKGARGGIGNNKNKTPKPPKQGEEKKISLELKIVADVGFVGFPNAGKSTLISNISKVKSKIANYPFTTKQPILGIVEYDDDFKFVVADLPGIIEGAHEGKGLGDRFLRHAERTKILVHIIDMAGTETRDPLKDYSILSEELLKYKETFAFKEKLVVANKLDLPEAKKNLARFKRKYKELEIIPISAINKEGLDILIKKIYQVLCHENFQDQSNEL